MSVLKDACVMTSPQPGSAVDSKSKAKTNALKFPPCFVCTGKASGLHYGVNSCEACKGFFRRYLLRNEEYKCSKGGNCEITSRHRGNCSGCRLTKCLSLGMSKNASRLGRYTLSRRTETIVKVKQLEEERDVTRITLPQTAITKGSNSCAIVKGQNTILSVPALDETYIIGQPSSNESGYISDILCSCNDIDSVSTDVEKGSNVCETEHNSVNTVIGKGVSNSLLNFLLVRENRPVREDNISNMVTNNKHNCECPITDDVLCGSSGFNKTDNLESLDLSTDPFSCDLFLDSSDLFRQDHLNKDDISSKLFVETVTALRSPGHERFREHTMLGNLLKYMDNIRPHGKHFTDKEKVEKMMNHHEKYSLNTKIFGTLKAVPDEEYYTFLRDYGIDLDGRWAVLKQSKYELEDIVERYVQFAKQVPGFATLSVNDQSNLLKVSRCDFFLILMHKGYLPDKQIFLAHNGQAYHLEEAADKFFSRNLFKTILKQYHQWQLLDINEEEMALLVSISITFSDRCKLDNPKFVERIQLHLMELLRNALERSSPVKAHRRFCKIIDCFVQMRESSEMYFTEYKKLCSNDMIIEEVPMMMEFLLEDF